MKKNLALSGALLSLVGLAAGCGSDAAADTGSSEPQTELTIAMTPVSDDVTAENPVDAFAGLVGDETGMSVEVTDVPDYLSVVEALRGQHADLAVMSAFPSALAIGTGEVDALVAWEGDGRPVSTCMVRADSGIETLEDLRGGTVAFADQASSSGYFLPVHMLDEAGLTQDEDYEVVFAGGHDAGWIALEQGEVDAACTAVMLTEIAVQQGVFAEGETRNVGESAAMPVSLVVLVRSGMNDATREALTDALPRIFAEHAEELGVLAQGTQGDALVEPDPSVFQPLVDIAAVAGVELQDLE